MQDHHWGGRIPRVIAWWWDIFRNRNGRKLIWLKWLSFCRNFISSETVCSVSCWLLWWFLLKYYCSRVAWPGTGTLTYVKWSEKPLIRVYKSVALWRTVMFEHRCFPSQLSFYCIFSSLTYACMILFLVLFSCSPLCGSRRDTLRRSKAAHLLDSASANDPKSMTALTRHEPLTQSVWVCSLRQK